MAYEPPRVASHQLSLCARSRNLCDIRLQQKSDEELKAQEAQRIKTAKGAAQSALKGELKERAQQQRDEKAAANAPATPAKTTDTKAADASGAPASEQAKGPEAELEAMAKKFRKGRPAPRGLDAKGVMAYAISQGDPARGTFTLEQALEGDAALADKSKGKLKAPSKRR